jgi:D-3-phosphoglycerate dehydrogenase
MKIAIVESQPHITPQYLTYLTQAGHELIPYGQTHNPQEMDAIIIRSNIIVDNKLLENYNQLQYVLRVGVGIENIDTTLLQQKNITLINTAWSNAQAVAELTIRGMLSILRNTQHPREQTQDRFSMIGDELNHKTIAIVGIGNIGRIVHRILQSFGNNTFLIYDPYAHNRENTANTTFVETKQDFLSQADIITLHMPLTPDTKNFLAAQDFAMMKKNVKIINTSRWAIIDEQALIHFLQNNPNAGAHIDTRTSEPDLPNTWLQTLANCIITPHLGAMTQQANKAMHYFSQLLTIH